MLKYDVVHHLKNYKYHEEYRLFLKFYRKYPLVDILKY